MVSDEELKKSIVEYAEKLESKPISDLNNEEILALISCRIGDNIKERGICYKGFFEGVKYNKEKSYED